MQPRTLRGDEATLSGYCMYTVSFPIPRWSGTFTQVDNQIDRFKNELFEQLTFVVKREDLHAGFIDVSSGQPRSVVIQASTVLALKMAFVEIYRVITGLVDLDWSHAAFDDELIDMDTISLNNPAGRDQYVS